MSRSDARPAQPCETEMTLLSVKSGTIVDHKQNQPLVIFPFEEKEIASALTHGIFTKAFLNELISWLQFYGYSNDTISKILNMGYLTPEAKSHPNDPNNIFFEPARLEKIIPLIMSETLVEKCLKNPMFEILVRVNFKCLLQILGVKCEDSSKKLAYIFDRPFLFINLNSARILAIEEIFNLPNNVYLFLIQSEIFLKALADDKVDCRMVKAMPLAFLKNQIFQQAILFHLTENPSALQFYLPAMNLSEFILWSEAIFANQNTTDVICNDPNKIIIHCLNRALIFNANRRQADRKKNFQVVPIHLTYQFNLKFILCCFAISDFVFPILLQGFMQTYPFLKAGKNNHSSSPLQLIAEYCQWSEYPLKPRKKLNVLYLTHHFFNVRCINSASILIEVLIFFKNTLKNNKFETNLKNAFEHFTEILTLLYEAHNQLNSLEDQLDLVILDPLDKILEIITPSDDAYHPGYIKIIIKLQDYRHTKQKYGKEAKQYGMDFDYFMLGNELRNFIAFMFTAEFNALPSVIKEPIRKTLNITSAYFISEEKEVKSRLTSLPGPAAN